MQTLFTVLIILMASAAVNADCSCYKCPFNGKKVGWSKKGDFCYPNCDTGAGYKDMGLHCYKLGGNPPTYALGEGVVDCSQAFEIDNYGMRIQTSDCYTFF